MTIMTPLLIIIGISLIIKMARKNRMLFYTLIVITITQFFWVPGILRFNILSIPHDGENNIKISTFNAGTFKYKNNNTIEYVSMLMEKENVDIVCFQEYRGNYDLKEFPYKVIQQDDPINNTGLAIYSKYPIIDSVKEIFTNGINGSMYADIQYNNKVIRVVNCHLQTTGISTTTNDDSQKRIDEIKKNMQIREVQANYLARFVETFTLPTILCGDFNSTPLSYVYRVINRSLKDSYREMGNGYSSTYNGGFKGILKIDYIFHSKEFECTNYYTSATELSDHNTVFSSLNLGI